MTFNPNKKLKIEIYANDMGNVYGYTIWHIVGKERKAAISRQADAEDFDFMTDKQMTAFNKGCYKFTMTAQMAADIFSYYY